MFNSKTIGTMLAIVAIGSVVVAPAVAQNRGQGRDDWERSGRTQQHWQIRRLIDATERSSNAFRDAIEQRDRQTDTRNRRGTTAQERFFNELTPNVRRLDESLESLRSVADNNRPGWGRREMTQILTRARTVDRYFVGNMFGTDDRNRNDRNDRNDRNGRYSYDRSRNLEARWRALRDDINAMARAYGMDPLQARRGW